MLDSHVSYALGGAVWLTLTLGVLLPHGLKLCFELLVLRLQLVVGILDEGFQHLNPVVSSEQSSLGSSDLFLEGRVLLDQLNRRR